MKTITTVYLPATDTKGARVKACASDIRPLTVSFWCDDDPHAAAALALARREGWTGKLARGGLPSGTGDAFCFIDDRYTLEV